LPFGRNSEARLIGLAKIGRRRNPVCKEAGSTCSYSIEQRLEIGHGGSRQRASTGFGFLRSSSPGAATRRRGSFAADHAVWLRITLPGAAPGRQTAISRDTQCIEQSSLPQWFHPIAARAAVHHMRVKSLNGKTGLE
jgi:hypothetical protein